MPPPPSPPPALFTSSAAAAAATAASSTPVKSANKKLNFRKYQLVINLYKSENTGEIAHPYR